MDPLSVAVDAHPDKTIRLWFQDEARAGQKGRLCHRWWQKGQRPPGRCDKRFKWAYIFGAVAPETGEASGLVLPRANTLAMSVFLAEFAKTLPENEHAVMVLDQAGWHAPTPLRSRTTSPWSRCRPTAPSSIQSNGFGSISDNAS